MIPTLLQCFNIVVCATCEFISSIQYFNTIKTISIGNSMVSSAIWKKHARVCFSKTIKTARVRRTSSIWDFWKTHECVFFQIARETLLLLINNIHDKIMQNESYACVTWKIIYSLLIVNIFTTKNICQNDRTKTMTELKQCVLIIKIVKISNIALYFL